TLATTTDNDVPVGRGGWVERDVPNFLLSGGTTYLLILRSPNTVNSANAWIWHALVAETGYEGCTYDGANSVLTSSANAGSSWSDIATRDAPFVLVRYPHWTQLESRSCTVNSPSNWVGIEGLSGTVQSVQVSWYLLDSWTDSVQVPANWLALDTWTGNGNSVAPSWLQLDLWTSSVQTIPQWCQLEAEACAVGTLAGWAAVDSWVCGANSVTPIWNLLEPWSGAVNTLVGWDPLDSWTSQVQATAAWSTVDSWTGTASSVSPSWSLLESCSGAVQTTAQWGQLDSWDAAVRVTVGWSTIEIWAGSVSTVPSSWQPLDYCSCAVQATAVWSTLDSWAGIAGSVPPTWQQLDSWTGAVQSAPTHWYLLESCSAAAQSVPCWNLLESRGGAISGLVAWLQVESLSGSVGTVPVWSALDQSTGSVTAPAAWFEVESWTGTVCAPLPVPTKPLLRRPENGAVVWDEVEVCFEWENAQYAENHRIEVALDANFTQLVDNETLVAENRWIKPLGYREGTYYWRVVAVGLGGENTSDTRVFYSRWRPIYGNQFAHSSDFDYQLDSTSENLSFRFQPPESKTVENVSLYVSALVGTPTYVVGIASDSSGLPGPFLSSSTWVPSATGWCAVDLPNLTLSAGATYHLVVSPSSVDANNYASLRTLNYPNARYPYDQEISENLNVLYFEGGWRVERRTPTFMLNYTDGTSRGVPYRSTVARNINESYDQAQKFTPSENLVVDRLRVYIGKLTASPEGNLQWAIRVEGQTSDLYSGTFALPTDNDIPVGRGLWVEREVSDFTLQAGITYRLILRSRTTTSANSWVWYTSRADDSSWTYQGWSSVHSTYDVLADAWTDYSTIDAPFLFVLSSQWRRLEEWSASTSTSAGWMGVEGWLGTATGAASWAPVEGWQGAMGSVGSWVFLGQWSGSCGSLAGWSWLDSWQGSVLAPFYGWIQLEAWTCLVSTVVEWRQAEGWSGMVGARAGWEPLEGWTGTAGAVAGWWVIEVWSGSAGAPCSWCLLELWGGFVEGYASWQAVETRSGEVSAISLWRPLESWIEEIGGPAWWRLVETWQGGISSITPGWFGLEVLASSCGAWANWFEVESWLCGLSGLGWWRTIDSWSGSLSGPSEWQPFENWT
ncbi:MAG: hypothetical protein QW356_08710, partial [Candidatus Hadarchaeales archaeon]